MKAPLSMLVLAAALLGGCATHRPPMANIAPSYSYLQDGLVLNAAPTRPTRVSDGARPVPEAFSLTAADLRIMAD